jgi:hypothetical protein
VLRVGRDRTGRGAPYRRLADGPFTTSSRLSTVSLSLHLVAGWIELDNGVAGSEGRDHLTPLRLTKFRVAKKTSDGIVTIVASLLLLKLHLCCYLTSRASPRTLVKCSVQGGGVTVMAAIFAFLLTVAFRVCSARRFPNAARVFSIPRY